MDLDDKVPQKIIGGGSVISTEAPTQILETSP